MYLSENRIGKNLFSEKWFRKNEREWLHIFLCVYWMIDVVVYDKQYDFDVNEQNCWKLKKILKTFKT